MKKHNCNEEADSVMRCDICDDEMASICCDCQELLERIRPLLKEMAYDTRTGDPNEHFVGPEREVGP